MISTEESIQQIAEGLYISRRTCQRHITAIYEKIGVRSRMGLYQLFVEEQGKPDRCSHGVLPPVFLREKPFPPPFDGLAHLRQAVFLCWRRCGIYKRGPWV